jgi:hypothetical protein
MVGKPYFIVLRNAEGEQRSCAVTFTRTASSHDCFAVPVLATDEVPRWRGSVVVGMSGALAGRVLAGPEDVPRVLLDHSLSRYRSAAEG